MPAIQFEGLSKHFRLYEEKITSLKDRAIAFLKGKRSTYQIVEALRDVSFEIEEAETVAIIGANASGKSTLLKIASGIIQPTRGTVGVEGRVAPLLELGMGFHPELTGAENIFLCSSLMGIKKREIKRKFQEIVEFAELERFINTPIKHYSSGMFMRLGFSLATSFEPDILLVDECMAVGDESFQRKCIERFKEFQEKGKTILFVSHDMGLVKQACQRALWLKEGSIQRDGPTSEVVEEYSDYQTQKEGQRLRSPAPAEPSKKDQKLRVLDVRLLDDEGHERNTFTTGEDMVVKVEVEARERLPVTTFGVAIYRVDGLYVYGPNTLHDGCLREPVEGRAVYSITYKKLPLLRGTYSLCIGFFDEKGFGIYDYHDMIKTFRVTTSLKDDGLIYLEHQWKLERLE